MLCACMLSHSSCVWLCDPMDCSLQTPLSLGLSRQEYWSRLLCPPTGDLPEPGTEVESLMSPALTGRFFPTSGHSDAYTILEIIFSILALYFCFYISKWHAQIAVFDLWTSNTVCWFLLCKISIYLPYIC